MGINLFLYSFWVRADVPTTAEIAGGLKTDAGPVEMVKTIVSSGVGIGAIAVAAGVMIGTGVVVFSAFKEANEKDKWGKFGLVFLAGAFVVAFVIVLLIFAVQYGTFSTTTTTP